MKGLLNVLWFFYKSLAFYTLVVFALTYWIPSSNWFLGFLMMSFPVTVVLNLVALIFWLLVKPKRAVIPLALLLVATIFLPRTYAFNSSDLIQKEEKGANTFKLMNYNVFGFYTLAPEDQKKEEMARMREWVVESGPDIVCMPEYYTNPNSKRFNMTAYFQNHGYPYKMMSRPQEPYRKDYLGLALLSKYPIVFAKDTNFSITNGLVLADVKIHTDTVRIIAVHLYSMTLKLNTLVSQKEMSGIKREGRDTFARMKNGFKQRGHEIDALISWIKASPYPVVVCGDFNETPYSYVYGKAHELLSNAFEEKGSGFGYSYNKLPYFIRIDHQFYDKEKLDLLDFRTNRSIKFSDHYPLTGVYAIKK